MKRLLFYILLCVSVFWFVFITYLSHQNGAQTGQTSYRIAEKICTYVSRHSGNKEPDEEDVERLNRKLRRAAHTVTYTVLSALVVSTVLAGRGGRREVLIACAALLLWSVIDEATKPLMDMLGLIPGRHFSWFDVGLNVAGVVIGSILVLVAPGDRHAG